MTGSGTVKRLEKHGIHTMGELARYSLHYQDTLYKEFGVDAELLIDHYGRTVPKGAHGSTRLDNPTNLGSQLIQTACVPVRPDN